MDPPSLLKLVQQNLKLDLIINIMDFKEIRAISVPVTDVNLSVYWGDIYESVYCYFKPFFFTKNKDWFDFLDIKNLNDLNDFYSENTKTTWSDIAKILELKDNYTVLKELNNNEIYKTILSSNNLIEPFFDSFAPYQIDEISNFLFDLNYFDLFLLQEFSYKNEKISIKNNLEELKLNFRMFNHIITPDSKIFIGNGFDYYKYSFVCSDKSIIKNISKKCDGFICDMNLSTTWNPVPSSPSSP